MKLISAAIVAVLFAVPAWAQCGPLEHVAQSLANDYGESMVSYGIASDGTMIQTWANVETGSWTAVRTNGEIGCLIAAGDGFALVPPAPNL